MSQTRILCEKCGFPQAYCTCGTVFTAFDINVFRDYINDKYPVATPLAQVCRTILAHITEQARRLAEVEAAYKHVKECLHTSQDRAQRAEERIQELEEQNG